jgi:hypothetical protein
MKNLLLGSPLGCDMEDWIENKFLKKIGVAEFFVGVRVFLSLEYIYFLVLKKVREWGYMGHGYIEAFLI